MFKKSQRIIAIILAVILMVTVVPADTAVAALKPAAGTEDVYRGTEQKDKAEQRSRAAHKKHTYKTTGITKATTKRSGSIRKQCTICKKKTKTAIYYPKYIKLSYTSLTYNGKSRRPTVSVKDKKGKKVSSKYYSVSYKNNKNIGTATVTIKFRGNYSGTVKKTFQIRPRATAITKISAKTGSFGVRWKKQSSKTSGYQLQYSTNSKFKSAKNVWVKSNKTTAKTVTGLKSSKTYYVRIRTYSKVKTGGREKTYYSTWSKTKKVKTTKKPSVEKPSAGKTDAEVYNAMIALKGQYPEGMWWTNANYYPWKGGIYSGGYGCAGFAFLLSDAAFGSAPARTHQNFDAIRTGDIIRLNYDTHSVIVLNVESDGVIVAEGNYNSSIHWGRKISYSEIKQTGTYVMTRYP